MSITMIGPDIAKTAFQVHGVDEEGRAKIKRKLRRADELAAGGKTGEEIAAELGVPASATES